MSILVMGMEMPSGCHSCVFGNDEARFCKAAKEYIPMLGTPKFCPLRPLPEKHGRLGDLTALEESLYKRYDDEKVNAKFAKDRNDNEAKMLALNAMGVFIETINQVIESETIVEAEGDRDGKNT